MSFEKYIQNLLSIVSGLQHKVSRLRLDNKHLKKENKLLKEQLLLVQTKLSYKRLKRDSHNSSLAPSTDMGRQKSLRSKSDKPVGGQKGHKGSTLKQIAKPDSVIAVKSSFCRQCGSSLESANHIPYSKRQVIDIPPIKPIYTEYQQYHCQCPNCSKWEVAPYPKGVNAPIQYGTGVASLVSYLSVYQCLPFGRMQSLFKDFLHLPLSQGTMVTLLSKVANKSQFLYERIKQELYNSKQVGTDETGAKVNGEKWWVWVWQNEKNTYLTPDKSRGKKVIRTHWENGFPFSTIVSDRLPAQLSTQCAHHQLCLAHLLRESIFLKESEKHPFAEKIQCWIQQVFKKHKQGRLQGKQFAKEDVEIIKIKDELNQLLTNEIDKKKYPKTSALHRSMVKYKTYLMPCLYDIDIPPDNNASERAIRNVKVKQKVSQQFKTMVEPYCIIRSIVDTMIKRGLEPLQYIEQIARI